MINRLKDGDLIAIDYFYHQLNGVVEKAIPVAIVPSHDPIKPNRGLIGLVEKLGCEGRVDATSCLVRHNEIISSHDAAEHGQDRRDMNRHLSSIKVCNTLLITSKTLLLLDDIVRTGTSLMACRELLLSVGATKVICLAFGRATQ
jgi:predicted amidophosphoribosyltransferase